MSDPTDEPLEVGARYRITEGHENTNLVSDTFTVENIRVATPRSDLEYPCVDVVYDAGDCSIQAESVPLSDLRSKIRRGIVERTNDGHDAGKRRMNIETGEREDTPSDTEKLNEAFDTFSSPQ